MSMSEDESVFSYDNYAARQRLESWEAKKVCPLEEQNDLDEIESLAEAVLWCCGFGALLFAGLIILTN